jgi:hypothetical protein
MIKNIKFPIILLAIPGIGIYVLFEKYFENQFFLYLAAIGIAISVLELMTGRAIFIEKPNGISSSVYLIRKKDDSKTFYMHTGFHIVLSLLAILLQIIKIKI